MRIRVMVLIQNLKYEAEKDKHMKLLMLVFKLNCSLDCLLCPTFKGHVQISLWIKKREE